MPKYERMQGKKTDCVCNATCFSSGSYISFSVDGDSDHDYCLNKKWWDCGNAGDTTGCGDL